MVSSARLLLVTLLTRAAPAPRNYAPPNYSQGRCGARVLDRERVVYNRVAKAGSTEMIDLAKRVARRHRGLGRGLLRVVDKGLKDYWMSADKMAAEISRLPEHSILINHMASLADSDPSRQAWMNFVREPLARACSEYYYRISKSGPLRRSDERCGCDKCSFEQFIQIQVRNKCSEPIFAYGSTIAYFCPVRGKQKMARCTVQRAMAHVERSYAFVGLTEHYELSVAALEAMLPTFFRGASCEYAHMRRKNVGKHDTASCASNATRALMRRQDPTFVEEERFYELLQARFWCQVSKLGLTTKPTPKKCA